MSAETNVLAVPCPTCGVMRGRLCNDGQLDGGLAHRTRWEALTAPTPAPEVREEWGVRDMDGDIWWNREPGRAETEQFVGDDEALVHRTITTYADGSFLTTPWVEVES